jgi:hypothetical protein
LHFVRAPDVAFYRALPDPAHNVRFITTVHVDLALPQGGHGLQAGIDVTGATADLPGLRRVAGVRRCYEEVVGRRNARYPASRVNGIRSDLF